MRSFAGVCAVVFGLVGFAAGQQVEVTLPSAMHGHLILIFAKSAEEEPRMQMSEDYRSAQAFGVDSDGKGGPLVIDAATVGYPRRSLRDLEAGDYFVQGVFNVYEQFHLATGKTVWLPPDKGEGQHWNEKPGNPYNAPLKVHWDGKTAVKVTLDKILPSIAGTDADPEVLARKQPAAKWLKYMKFKSEKLSVFWGKDTYLGAWILLPDGFEEHPDAKYPVVVYQDHYHAGFGPVPFVTSLADAKGRGASGYRFFQDWTSNRLPRVIMIYVQNANPYYDDSYVVDSANVGPYGSAINEELIPAIEKQYRGIGAGWARATLVVQPAVGRRWRRRSSTRTCTTAPMWLARIRSTSMPTRILTCMTMQMHFG